LGARPRSGFEPARVRFAASPLCVPGYQEHRAVACMPLSDIGAAIAAAVRTINQTNTLDDMLTAIAETARRSVPGFDHVGISTIDRDGQVRTRAAAGDLVWKLDELQYDLGEGPCVDSLRDGDVVLAPRIRTDDRWPNYAPKAADAGVKSQLAVKLYLDSSGTLGGLNLYSTESEDIDPDAENLADLFAMHAAIALGHAEEREHLNEALHSRKLIGQAIGILMERYQLNEDRAFSFLIRASSHGNVKLRDVAAELVQQANQR
jgi:GAF domain-containing protein